MNQFNGIGRLGQDPIIKNTSSGSTVANMSIAIDRGKDKEGNKLGADWIRVVAFGKLADNCERFLTKGKLVGVTGRIQSGSYEDKDGKKVYTTDIIASNVQFLEWGDTPAGGTDENKKLPEGFAVLDDDLPF